MMKNNGGIISIWRLSRSIAVFVSLFTLSAILDRVLPFNTNMMIRAEKTDKQHYIYEEEMMNNRSMYVVYMGAVSSSSSQVGVVSTSSSLLREEHLHLLASVVNVKNTMGKEEGDYQLKADEAEKRLVHSYKHGFSGFAALLSKEEARVIAKLSNNNINGGERVVSVFEDPVFHLHTTRSWDFLQLQTDIVIDHHSHADKPRHLINSPLVDEDYSGSGTIIGILDTGIWPESESFSDQGMGPIPSRWKGECMREHDFKCNKKLIGARYYVNNKTTTTTSSSGFKVEGEMTTRDIVGHGTHTASTAAGASVSSASYYGLASGTAKGGSPQSRIAVYKVCTSSGCRGSTILAAFDDAIADGVDVLSLSLGASSFMKPDFSTDPIAIGAFHAVQKGITVVCSAGNDGPTSGTVVNAAPWILTVAATTIDRDFESNVVLGDASSGANKVIKGESINFSTLKKSPIYPLINASSAKLSSSSESDARNCNPDSLDKRKIKGKIVLCEHSDTSYTKREKMEGVKEVGGVGLVLIDDLERAVAFPFGTFPLTVISSGEAAAISSYINSTSNPIATILPTVVVNNFKPAPMVAYFSSRGPSLQTRNLLKPDISAPGVNILAAWMGKNDTSDAPADQKPSQFNLLSGTSMSCPHISGIAATIKSKNPTWSPSMIRSAIMTTATQTNNEKAMIRTDSNVAATPYDYGAGEVNPSEALQPGLVYEINPEDYLVFLCNYGYRVSEIKLISSNLPDGFDCPKNSSKDLISELNYPSIAISNFNGKETKKVSRTVTNVGVEDETVYTASVDSPPELEVMVVPSKLEFSKSNNELSYEVTFSAATSTSTVTGDRFGSITWSNGKHKVRTTFVVATA